MPKMKTHKGVAKRIKRTASGKLRRSKSGRRHLLSHKSPKRRARLRKSGFVTGKVAKKIEIHLP